MDYDVITIDTNIFKQYNLKLESSLLGHLAQFKEGSVEFVMPDVIHQELIRHLRSNTCDASKDLSSISKKIEEFCLLEEEQRVEVNKILDKILDKVCPEDIVDARLKLFEENTGLKILRCGEFVDVDEILLKYHEAHPPFAGKKNENNENAEKKNKNAEKKNKNAEKKSRKAEFPDAFALLCLESWASQNDKKILAVSKDCGWQEFGASSPHIDVIEDLSEALEKLQPGVSGAMKYASIFLKQLYGGKRPADMKSIKDTLIEEVSNLTPFVEFNPVFQCYSFVANLEFLDFKFCPDKFDKESTHLVRVGRNRIVILMRIEVSVQMFATLQLTGVDGMGKDDVLMGNEHIGGEDEIQFEVLLTLNREEDTVELIEMEWMKKACTGTDFGFIAPG